ncbi:septal ring lytic transglycosylase RlpA family protein [Synechococcus sp. A15-28]|uniref:septal ring lytic transglycosylase RlpA family protein n=1 Tax=Synechococcus sp. A15-28 TaxID=1050638 RepID=UPI0016475D90|nr:septal ring lytic transglycosylase RlpA family protein [Synechococcus sp. A15-28]QNI43264.1 rare lipoA family protein [Synechococcus sp. A15-28]
MRVVLTLLGLCGAISASAALFPVVAQDFEDQDGFDPLDPMELFVESAADLEPFSNPASELNLSVENELDQDSTENRNVNAVLTPVAVLPEPKLKLVPDVVRVITGEASWYGPGFYGNYTANGEIYRQGTMTAAHRTLPFGTKVRVTNLRNGRSAVIRINDRGPFVDHRVIDLGHGAASSLGLISSGIAQVKLEVLR